MFWYKISKIFPLILTCFRLYQKTPEIPLEIKLHRMKIYPTNCCLNTPDFCNYTRSGNTATRSNQARPVAGKRREGRLLLRVQDWEGRNIKYFFCFFYPLWGIGLETKWKAEYTPGPNIGTMLECRLRDHWLAEGPKNLRQKAEYTPRLNCLWYTLSIAKIVG